MVSELPAFVSFQETVVSISLAGDRSTATQANVPSHDSSVTHPRFQSRDSFRSETQKENKTKKKKNEARISFLVAVVVAIMKRTPLLSTGTRAERTIVKLRRLPSHFEITSSRRGKRKSSPSSEDS